MRRYHLQRCIELLKRLPYKDNKIQSSIDYVIDLLKIELEKSNSKSLYFKNKRLHNIERG